MAKKKRKGVFAHDIDRLNMWFAIVAVAAFVSVMWMIWDDYARPWKAYQRQFQVIQNEVTQQQLADEQARVDQQALTQLRQQLEAARHPQINTPIFSLKPFRNSASGDEPHHQISLASEPEWIVLSLEPGITENKLWSILHQTNIEMGGEWIETRLLTSGQRTNPWFQECSNRVIQKGDLVSFDTDLIGPNGYCSDTRRLRSPRKQGLVETM